MANLITGIRIICSIALLFCPVFSPVFYALYITAGVSDMIDGEVARKTGSVSAFGSKLDIYKKCVKKSLINLEINAEGSIVRKEVY